MTSTQPADPAVALTQAITTYTQAVQGLAVSELVLDRARAQAIMANLRAQQQGAQPPRPTGWSKTLFWDNFTGDLSNYSVRDSTTQNNTYCNNFARNVGIKDGVLAITGRREVTTVFAGGGSRTCEYSSGYVDTSTGRLPITKGTRLEIEALFPTIPGFATGIWPALWLRSRKGRGEWDMGEAWGEPTTGANALKTTPEVYRTGSFSTSCYANTDDPKLGKKSAWGTPVGSPPIGKAFHKFIYEWDDAGMRGSFDTNPPHLVVRYADTPWLETAFPSDDQLELRMNLQIGNEYWGLPTPTTRFPVEMLISSVRVLGR